MSTVTIKQIDPIKSSADRNVIETRTLEDINDWDTDGIYHSFYRSNGGTVVISSSLILEIEVAPAPDTEIQE